MLKGFIDKLFQTNQKPIEPAAKPISQEEIEALVEARLKEHTAIIEKTITEQVNINQTNDDKEDYSLTPKQIEFALELITRTKEFELATNPGNLTVKDLNKLIAYNKYKNKGILVNLAKKGILRKR